MLESHCHRCGGFIGNPARTTYREGSAAIPPASPHNGLCVCSDPVVNGPAPESAGRGARLHRLRSASRN